MFSALKSTVLKLKTALIKTSSKLGLKLKGLFTKPFDEELLEEIERTLYEADLGSSCIEQLLQALKEYHLKNPEAKEADYIQCLKNACEAILNTVDFVTPQITAKPHVILLYGVNGSGKTTSCAKLAKRFIDDGKKVLTAAADTFRAAAIEQLSIWAERLNIEIVKGKYMGDPASVVFDAITKAKAQNFDIAIIDTAGRLESKSDLMKELEKIYRTAKKVEPLAPHATYLVIDATIGQTALEQIQIFNSHAPINGIILTKLDGTAKGGIVLAIVKKFKIPVYFVGVGEKAEDLIPFDKEAYIDGLFSS